MKKTSKRKKFAKILATFLGTSATLIPIAALVSCEQTAKTPVVKEEKKQNPQDPPPPNPQNPKTPGNGGGNNNNEQFIPDNEQNIDGVQIGSIKDKEKNIIGKEIKGTLNIDSIKKLIDELNEKKITDIKSDEFKITCKNELFSKNLLEKLAKKLSVTKIENTTNNGIQNIELDKNATIKTIDGNIALKDITQNTSSENNITIKQFINDQIQKTENNSITISGSITSNETEQFSKEKLQNVAKALSVTKIENTTNNGIQNIELNKDSTIKTIDGNIALKDIIDSKNQETTKIVDYIIQDLKNKNTDFDSSKLKINTFYKKPKAISTTTSISRNIITYNNGTEFEYILTDITPEVFEENDGFTKTSLNYKDEKGNIYIKLSGSFDITKLYNKVKNNKKLYNILNDNTVNANDIKGSILLTGTKTPNPIPSIDNTEYAKVEELLNLIKNPKLKDKIIVDNVQLAGNVKNLLPILVNNEIKEKNGGIVFGNANNTPCEGKLWTGFDGGVNRSILSIEELQELHKRSRDKTAYIRNAIIENLNCKQPNFDIENTHFTNDEIANLEFRGKNTDLTNISFEYVSCTGKAIFTGVLPKNMGNATFNDILIQDAIIPELKNINPDFNSPRIDVMPIFNDKLTIKNLKGLERIFQEWTKQEIETFTIQQLRPHEYKGPKNIYKEIQRLYYKRSGDDNTIYFTDENGNIIEGPYYEDENDNFHPKTTGSINKNKNQYLALLKQRNDKVHA